MRPNFNNPTGDPRIGADYPIYAPYYTPGGPKFDPNLYTFQPRNYPDYTYLSPLDTPYNPLGGNPWIQGLQMGLYGSLLGLGAGAVQQGILKMRGEQGGPENIWNPMLIGALIGSTLGTAGGFRARKAQQKDVSNMTWQQIGASWPKQFSDNTVNQGITRGLLKLAQHDSSLDWLYALPEEERKAKIREMTQNTYKDAPVMTAAPKQTFMDRVRQGHANRMGVWRNRAELQKMELDPEYRRISALVDPKKSRAGSGTGIAGVPPEYYNMVVNPGHVPGQANIGLGPWGGSGVRDQFLGAVAVPATVLAGPAVLDKTVGPIGRYIARTPLARKILGRTLATAAAAYETERAASNFGQAAGMAGQPDLAGQRRRAIASGAVHSVLGAVDAATAGGATAAASKVPYLRHLFKRWVVPTAFLTSYVADPELAHPGFQVGKPVPTQAQKTQLEQDYMDLLQRAAQYDTNSVPNTATNGISRSLVTPLEQGVKHPINTIGNLAERYRKALSTPGTNTTGTVGQ